MHLTSGRNYKSKRKSRTDGSSNQGAVRYIAVEQTINSCFKQEISRERRWENIQRQRKDGGEPKREEQVR